MLNLNVKRLKQIERLLTESNIILAQGADRNRGDRSDSQEPDEQSAMEAFDKYLDKFLDVAIDIEGFKDIEIKRGKMIVEKYLGYCKNRLNRLAQRLTAALESGDSQDEIREISNQQFNIAKKITLLDEIYTGLKAREDAEVKQIADDIVKLIEEIQKSLSDSYLSVIQEAGKRNFELIQQIEDTTVETDQAEIAAEIVGTWANVDAATANLDQSHLAELTRLKSQTFDRVKKKIGAERFETIFRSSGTMSREEADIVARIVRLNYTAFTSEEAVAKEIAGIRAKINALSGETKLRPAASPETIKYLTDMVDKAEAIIYSRLKDKSLSLKSAKGIHYDPNVKLKLYERVVIPVTGKQIADNSTIMKLRKNLQSLIDLLFGGGSDSITKAGQAWLGVGKRLSTIYGKTLNTTAKAAGKLIKGREGEMKADALSRLFIPDTSVIDSAVKSVLEDSVAPGVSNQVPGSIGGMGNPVAPTPTSLGSGDNFSARKSKVNKKKKVLEFKEFVSQYLK